MVIGVRGTKGHGKSIRGVLSNSAYLQLDGKGRPEWRNPPQVLHGIANQGTQKKKVFFFRPFPITTRMCMLSRSC